MKRDERGYKRICRGRYSLLKELGRGAMGRNILVRDNESGVEVALKMVHPSISDTESRMKELRELYGKIKGLHHPNIVAVKHLLKIPELRGEYALVTEYVPGMDLHKYRLKQPGERIDLRLAVRFASEIASGLDFTHANRILHRDIKPTNIMVTEDNKIKITDFGLARRFDSVSAVAPEELESLIQARSSTWRRSFGGAKPPTSKPTFGRWARSSTK